jgi:hypothetical protein
MTHFMPSSRTLYLIDGALALWVVLWIGLGVAIGVNVRNLTILSTTVATDGRAVSTVGQSLQSLGSVPLIGGQISRDATQVSHSGAATAASGRRSASSIRTLSVLLGIAVALLPSIPVLTFYLPARFQRVREARALRRALRMHGDDPEFHAFLARRAAEALGYHQLRRVSSSPWVDIAEGRCVPLARAELARLGVDRDLLRSPARSSR